MSRGIGGLSKKILEDYEKVIYEYAVYNSNCRESDMLFDGKIIINKLYLINDESIKEYKNNLNMCNEPKSLTFSELLLSNEAVIESCTHCFMKTSEGYDLIACYIGNKIIKEYKKSGKLLEKVSYDV